ncbi:ATP-dependent DNA ligase [Annulohypoxylon truncatum]|uniref:ATP-dependent DNA ligase n=1 Tax=Annulohypoxylon truncatum TaxID=327061 RepID=UPI00200780DB|nr:ATP-dependent DNA ligase [Annulohypoxylon truncatum]KAI1206594.1 ATP-dependent DNA ligase [Annulohypoxylon truncatum]
MSQRHQKLPDEGAKDEERRQYTTGGQTLEELDAKYPNRPKNHSKTFFFSELFKDLFDPLQENKQQSAPKVARRPRGPHRPSKLSPHEYKRNVIERFISRWRSEVGNDFYPAMRLILPSSDRDRGMYGLKESNIGRLLVKLMRIDRNSEDGYSLLHWREPIQSATGHAAGDFSGRCFDVLSKRPMRIDPGDMRIADVNEMLDKLSAASGENEQLPIFETFYQRMNAEELRWLIRIILRQMRVGATERTFMELWHPDALDLFSVSSSLRQVCWDLYDPKFRLKDGQTNVTLMQCFQPMLCHYQMSTSFQKMADKLNSTNRVEGDDEFWIEEKLDGERMQLHMEEDDETPGGKRFRFWSRKAKDYTYLYGNGFKDENGSLTRHLKDAFAPGVRNIILDGEMIVWDPELDKVLKFGTLKTAALAGQKNPHDDNAPRPVLRVFDILYLNGQPLTQYTLRDRRKALEKAVLGVPYRLEIHKYDTATSAEVIEPMLRKIVSDASEGLVMKNPRSMYSLADRSDNWIKVKPEYMSGFGESVEVVIIGGYYGQGHRGGAIGSFLCGLRASENDIKAGANPETCFSFLKVGGGFRAEDFADIRRHTDGKWKQWDPKKPPSKYIQLAGGERHQFLRPDEWIRPSDSLVISVKGASAGESDQFATGITLRFPRFKGIRFDRSWDSCLDFQGFIDMKARAEKENDEKAMNMESRRKRTAKRVKRDIVIAGQDNIAPALFEGPKTKVFEGLDFCVLTDCTTPVKKSKTQLETLIKENGGKIYQRADPSSHMILIAEKKVVKVASLLKAGDIDIIKPKWILDCLAQRDKDFLLPFETGHLFHATDATARLAEENVDDFGDSYARDLSVKELGQVLKSMPKKEIIVGEPFNKEEFLNQLVEHGHDMGNLRSYIFRGTKVHFSTTDDVSPISSLKLKNWIKYGGGSVVDDLDDRSITHVVIMSSTDSGEMERAAEVRSSISSRTPVPRAVSWQWVEDCWKNRTTLDEERYEPL